MNIALFYHSLLSDWNHGNAHFLRGVATELIRDGHQVKIYEEAGNWSLNNLRNEPGADTVIQDFNSHYPLLKSTFYNKSLNLDEALQDADLVIVHEWNDHALVKAIGACRKRHSFRLLFHDTHHRSVTDAGSMARYNLSNYDGVLAYGNVIRDIYLDKAWTEQAWTWHEAADINVFKPLPFNGLKKHLVWIGNWGDDERTRELNEYLVEPVIELKLSARVYGVRYPGHAKQSLVNAGIEYGGWLPNFCAPDVFAKYHFTVHVPRGPYTRSLPGIPTIRPFEALACGIPLISSPWSDVEHLFTVGKDFLMVRNKQEMKEAMLAIINDEALGSSLAAHGLQTILSKHTCAHRVQQLYEICEAIDVQNRSTYKTTSL